MESLLSAERTAGAMEKIDGDNGSSLLDQRGKQELLAPASLFSYGSNKNQLSRYTTVWRSSVRRRSLGGTLSAPRSLQPLYLE